MRKTASPTEVCELRPVFTDCLKLDRVEETPPSRTHRGSSRWYRRSATRDIFLATGLAKLGRRDPVMGFPQKVSSEVIPCLDKAVLQVGLVDRVTSLELLRPWLYDEVNPHLFSTIFTPGAQRKHALTRRQQCDTTDLHGRCHPSHPKPRCGRRHLPSRLCGWKNATTFAPLSPNPPHGPPEPEISMSSTAQS